MKINTKKINVEADVEKIIEKGMDNHEKDWKDKFTIKHTAKKEMEELKHSQKVEMEELKQKRKGFFERRAEEKRQREEMRIAEKIRKEKQERRNIILAVILVLFLIAICIVMSALGFE